MAQLLDRLGRVCVRRRWIVVAAWIAILVGVGLIGRSTGGYTDSFTLPGTEAGAAFDLLDARFPEQAGDTVRVVFAADDPLTDAPRRTALEATLDEIAHQPDVLAVGDPYSQRDGALSPDATIGFAIVTYPSGIDAGAALDRLDTAAETARAAGVQAEMGGEIVADAGRETQGLQEMIGIGVAVVVLLVAFGTVVAAGLPLLTALVGLGTGLMSVLLLSSVTDIATFAPTIATMIGLGVGIDYALFIVTRHREGLAAGLAVPAAVGRANGTAGVAVVFAGTTVVIAILGLQFVGIPFVATMGYATAIVVAVAVIAAVTFLPALLGIVGARIDRLRVPGVRRRHADDRSTLSARWAVRVSRRPVVGLVVAVLVLAVLAVPFFSMRLGQTDDGAAPPSTTQRRAYDLLAEGFGPGLNGPLLVVVDLIGASPDAVDAVVAAAAADPGVLGVADPQVNEAGDAAVVVAYPTSSPQDEATAALIHHLRDDVFPAVESQTGATVLVSGPTAAFVDVSAKISDRLPYFIGAVLSLSFLLLMVVFRSILVPLKAVLANLLSIGAAYGVVVMVFQWGWGMGLVGLEETVPIVSFLPMFMFAILFGLSMDYEVFLLSRVREEYARTGDNPEAVVTGMATTARVITAAAIIMVSVFAGFALGDRPEVKMSGLGLATAILLDATVVRLVLVPSTMALLGDWNWWLPRWLDRILPRLSLEGGPPRPAGPIAHADSAVEQEREAVSVSGRH